MSVLILGIGNPIMSDDSIGGRLLNLINQHYRFPSGVKLVDGETMGPALLHHLEGVEKLLVVDAVETGGPPGTLVRLAGEEVPRLISASVSLHQQGISDLLAVASLQGWSPAEVVVWGVQPASIGMGLELSPPVAAQMIPLMTKVVEELRRWEIEPVAC